MTTVSLEQESNPWEAQAARFDLAAQKLNLDEGIRKVLSYLNRGKPGTARSTPGPPARFSPFQRGNL